MCLGGAPTKTWQLKVSHLIATLVSVFVKTEHMKPILGLLAVIAIAADASAQTAQKMEASVYPQADMKWQAGPPSLPAGAKLALLEGDPTKEGPFTMRLLLPDGYKIPPHTHPKVEHVTVISGTFNLGMGEKFDESAGQQMPAGTFAFWPAGMKHFAWAKRETTIQLHGIGPWTINYLNPADDPRIKQ
jgi:quercetin dioxygenase-like cupin family protein